MITVEQIAEYIETGLNALIPYLPNDQTWQFKIWANAGERTKPLRNGNTVVYYIEGVLQVNTSAIEPNVLEMGVNGLTLQFTVPTQPPRTNLYQTAASLQEVQEGQLYFINTVGSLLSQYFTQAQAFELTDDDKNTFGVSMVSGVAIPSVIDISSIGKAIPMSVSITLNFVLGGINALNIKVYMDGERVPYQSFSPSRSAQLSTNVQSNSSKQTNLATSSLYAIALTCPSAANNYASSAILDYIAEPDLNTAHFIRVTWGDEREDIYLMEASSGNAMVARADFAGLTVNLCETYELEYLNYPEQFTVGAFAVAVSTGTSLSFTINANVTKTYPGLASGVTVPTSINFYYYIAGKAYAYSVPRTSLISGVGQQTAVFSSAQAVTVTLSDGDFVPTDTGYNVYLVMSDNATISDVTSGYTFNEE